MKKELLAVTLLLLLFAATIVNIAVNEHYMTELDDSVSRAYSYAENGDWQSAKDSLTKAVRRWEALDGYTHIFIRHSEIGSTTEAFYNMLSAVCAEDKGAVCGSYGLLHAQLLSLIGMEQVSIGSIF